MKINIKSSPYIVLVIGLILFFGLALAQPLLLNENALDYEEKSKTYWYIGFIIFVCAGLIDTVLCIKVLPQIEESKKGNIRFALWIGIGMVIVGIIGVMLNSMVVGY